MNIRRERSVVVAAFMACLVMHCGNDASDAGSPSGPSNASSTKDGGSGTGTDGSSSSNGASTSARGLDVSANTLDFGKVDCGAQGKASSVTLTNSTSAAIAWRTKLEKATASPFTVEPATGKVEPGATATVTITPRAIPSLASTANDGFSDTLTIVEDSNLAHPVTLHQTAHGAILAFTPTSTAFGAIALSTASNASIGVVNSGNADAHVAFAVPGGAPFAITPGGPTLIAGGGSATLNASYTPSALGTANDSVKATVAAGEVLCAPAPTLPLAGSGTNGALSIDNVSLTFGNAGLVDCGTTALPQQITIGNTGTGFFSWSGVISAGASFYGVSPTAGTLAPGTSQALTITPRAIPATSTVLPDAFAGTLTITTTAGGDVPHNIALHETARGAIVTRSLATASFGTVAVGTTSTQQFSYTNTGNVPITFTSSNANSVFSATSPITVSSGGTSLASSFFVPAALVAYTDQATLQVQGGTPLCAGIPAPMALTGTGGNSSVGVAPTTVAFGSVPCGTQATAQTVRITNNGPELKYATSLLRGDGSAFTITPASATGTIPPGGSALVTITPLPIPPISSTSAGAFNDSLVITTDNPTDTPHVVALTESALGAVLAFSKTSIAFPDTSTSQTNTAAGAFTVNNTGNLTVPVTLSVSDATHFDVSQLYPTVTANTNLPATAAFHPASAGTKTGTLSVSTTAPLCAPLPAAITLSGKGL